jgi:cytidylate kinase
MVSRKMVIAIDGPAGSGKSTVARRVADALHYVYIDTGAMYRAVALEVLRRGIAVSDEDEVVDVANDLEMVFRREKDGSLRLLVDGEDVTEEIRLPEVTELSSPVSAIHGVRQRLVELQRQMGRGGGVVMEGRDIQTVVFPQADVKVFLTASEDERARRRFAELQTQGINTTFAEVKRAIIERDERDTARDVAPLLKAPDGVELNTDGLTVDQVVEAVLDIVRSKADPKA